MKISLSQIRVVPNKPDINFVRIREEIDKAKSASVDLLVFSEMVVGGYMIGDEWENESFLRKLEVINEKIKELSKGVTIVWGNVDVDWKNNGEDGRARKYNSAFIATNGEWVNNGVLNGKTYKSLMPKYREFDDERYFYSMEKFARDNNIEFNKALLPFEVKVGAKKIKIGVMLCEDMWSDDYYRKPSEILAENGADVLVNISCSPWTVGKNDKRHRVVRSVIERTGLPLLYCNNVGIQNNGKNIFVFDGGSTAYSSEGKIVGSTESYAEDVLELNFDVENNDLLSLRSSSDNLKDEGIENIYRSLVYGISCFFENLPNKKVVIGLSGGVDSAVVACLLTEALGKENVTGVNMPSKFNSDLTKGAAATLARNLGIDYKVIPIQEAVDLTISQLEEAGFELSSLAKENIQARDRGSRVLAGAASALGAVFTNNGNKTETALGYCTLYGDVNGAIAPIADLYKGQVYELARYANTVMGEVIPKEILDVVPSAELSDKQDVTKGLGDPMVYPYHDKLLRAFVEWRTGKETLIELYKSGKISEYLQLEMQIDNYFANEKSFVEDLEDKWKKYKLAVFKRVQAPPIIAVSRRAFGFDLREAI